MAFPLCCGSLCGPEWARNRPLPAAVAEVVLLAFLLAARMRRQDDRAPEVVTDARHPVIKMILVAIVFFSVASAASYYVRFVRVSPYGGWDAWAIWNLHAKALFLNGPGAWLTVLPRLWYTHPDYPLLVPLNTARLWWFAGGENTSATRLMDLIFTGSIIGLVWSGLRLCREMASAALGVSVVLASTAFLFWATAQYADVPAAFNMLGTVVCLATAEDPAHRRMLPLAGLCCGLAAWTKNEGLLFAGCVTAAFMLSSFLLRRQSCVHEILLFAYGLLAPAAVLVSYKLRTAQARR